MHYILLLIKKLKQVQFLLIQHFSMYLWYWGTFTTRKSLLILTLSTFNFRLFTQVKLYMCVAPTLFIGMVDFDFYQIDILTQHLYFWSSVISGYLLQHRWVFTCMCWVVMGRNVNILRLEWSHLKIVFSFFIPLTLIISEALSDKFDTLVLWKTIMTSTGTIFALLLF